MLIGDIKLFSFSRGHKSNLHGVNMVKIYISLLIKSQERIIIFAGFYFK